MKKIYLSIIVLLGAISSQAQAPQAFSYQAVIRNTNNVLVANQLVGEKISLIKDSSMGTVVYSETQSVKTNANGLVSLQIGIGSILSGSFSGINWATGTYFIKIETDPTGGSKYTISNTTQLLSVPYALQAGSAPSLQYPDGLANASTVIIKPKTSYTIPTGKNFYFQQGMGFSINQDTLATTYPSQMIVGEKQTISELDSVGIVGFIVDKNVTAVTINLQNINYTVPQGKVFVLTGAYQAYFNNQVLVNGISLNPQGSSNGIDNLPLIFFSGVVFSGGSIINGYLK